MIFFFSGLVLATGLGIITMAVSETSADEHEFTATIGAMVASIINATWYTISKIYEKAVKSSIPAITVTDTDTGETIVLEGSFRGKTFLQRPVHSRQDKNLLVVPDIPGSRPTHFGNNPFSIFPSEVYMEQLVNRERRMEEMSRRSGETWITRRSPSYSEINEKDISSSRETCVTIVH